MTANPHHPTAGAEPRRRLDNRTLREQVFEHVREEILSSRLPPGAELNEVALARELGTSRGPLREALGRLAAEGLVKITPRRGAMVTQLTREEFLDSYQVREALESLAVRLAVPRLTEDELAGLRDMSDQMIRHAEAGDRQRFFEVNAHFHEAIVVASGNEKLREVHRLLIAQMGRMLSTSLALRGSLQQSVAEHRGIVEALEARDAERAARLIEEHIEVPLRQLEAHTTTQGEGEDH